MIRIATVIILPGGLSVPLAHLSPVSLRDSVVVQVGHDAGDAQRPGKTQQVGQVAESTAEQDGPAEGPVHRAPDGRRAIRVLRCLQDKGGGSGDITEMEGGREETRWTSPHPLVLVGVFEPQVVGERSHGDGQLADLLQLDGPLVGPHDERVHPPVGGLEEGQDPGETARHSLFPRNPAVIIDSDLNFNNHLRFITESAS